GVLPIEIASQGRGPIGRDRHRILRAERDRERRRVGHFVVAEVFVESLPIIRGRSRIKSRIIQRNGLAKEVRSGRYKMAVGIVLRGLPGDWILPFKVSVIAKTGGSSLLPATTRDLHDIDRKDAV